MSGNPLVVEPTHDSGTFVNLGSAGDDVNGLKFIDGGVDAADAFGRGDWIEGSVDGMSAGLDVVGAVLDPIGTVGSMIAGWLIEHLGPVQDWLDQLCGDPGSINANSTTWHHIAQRVASVSHDYTAAAQHDFGGQSGLTVQAYRSFAEVQGDMITALSQIADGVGAGIAVAGTLLAGVRDFISGTLADLIGQLIKVVGESLFTAGIMAPHALATAANKCREFIQRTRRFMEDLATSLDRMAHLLHEINPALEDGLKTLASISRRAGAMNQYELSALTSQIKSASTMDDNTPYSY